jgi:hypothetical protein
LRKFSLLVLVSFALGSVLVAQNAPLSKLKGDFPFNETLHIVEQPAVGGVCGATLSGPVSMVIYNDTGIWSFDGKGNVHMTDSGMFINVVPPTDASQVTPAAATCSGTYAMLDESTVDFHYNCSLDHGASYFQVHTTGKVTNSNILVEAWVNPDGSLPVTPYIYGNTIVGCSYVGENTTISRTP